MTTVIVLCDASRAQCHAGDVHNHMLGINNFIFFVFVSCPFTVSQEENYSVLFGQQLLEELTISFEPPK